MKLFKRPRGASACKCERNRLNACALWSFRWHRIRSLRNRFSRGSLRATRQALHYRAAFINAPQNFTVQQRKPLTFSRVGVCGDWGIWDGPSHTGNVSPGHTGVSAHFRGNKWCFSTKGPSVRVWGCAAAFSKARDVRVKAEEHQARVFLETPFIFPT